MKRHKIKNSIILLVLLSTLYSLLSTSLCGCGYTTGGATLPAGVKTIHVDHFLNKIDITAEVSTRRVYQVYHPLLEVDIRDSVIDRFLFDGNLRIATENKADWILKSELIEFRRDPLRYTDDEETVLEYRINIIVNLSLWAREGDLVWEQKNFVGDTTYFTQGSSSISEATAIDKAITDLARRIVERVIENW